MPQRHCAGDLVEITDDASELGPARGHLTQIASGPDPDQFTVVLADPLPASFVLGRGCDESAIFERRKVIVIWCCGDGMAPAMPAPLTTTSTLLG